MLAVLALTSFLVQAEVAANTIELPPDSMNYVQSVDRGWLIAPVLGQAGDAVTTIIALRNPQLDEGGLQRLFVHGGKPIGVGGVITVLGLKTLTSYGLVRGIKRIGYGHPNRAKIASAVVTVVFGIRPIVHNLGMLNR